ncbi:hypothetical protein [Brevibacterium album]|uniref:hypothetical protein n=1 Tax=Brevibacterium album TaxID=417948 RepID=UPI00048DE016|nr:hypothetical protein [Brevibacterium album]
MELRDRIARALLIGGECTPEEADRIVEQESLCDSWRLDQAHHEADAVIEALGLTEERGVRSFVAPTIRYVTPWEAV